MESSRPRRCHSSSVMNGMSGCNMRSAAEKTAKRLRQSLVSPVLSSNRSFLVSQYRSQTSFPKKRHNVFGRFVVAMILERTIHNIGCLLIRLKIQRSSTVSKLPRSRTAGGSTADLSMLMKISRAAFQILSTNFRAPVSLSSLKTTSAPDPTPMVSDKRSASVPKRLVMSSGSITFPLVFDILSRLASRTRP